MVKTRADCHSDPHMASGQCIQPRPTAAASPPIGRVRVKDSGSSLRAPQPENRDAFLLSASPLPISSGGCILAPGNSVRTSWTCTVLTVLYLYSTNYGPSYYRHAPLCVLSLQLSAVSAPHGYLLLKGILSCARALLIRPRAGTEERCGLPSCWRTTSLLIRRNPWPVLEP